MKTQQVKTSMEQIVHALIKGFVLQNFGRAPKYVYLPVDLFDHFTDIIEDQFRAAGMPAHLLDDAFEYVYMGVRVLECRTNDIIVSEELLP
jgi:hypothetical protein